MLKKNVKQALKQMSERNQEIMKKRFGLDDGKIMPIEEVCKKYNVSRARVRQLEARLISNLGQ